MPYSSSKSHSHRSSFQKMFIEKKAHFKSFSYSKMKPKGNILSDLFIWVDKIAYQLLKISIQKNKSQCKIYKILFMSTMFSKNHIVYPEDIQCVLDPINGKGGIFIGNLQAAENLQTLKKHKIKSVLTASKNTCLRHPKSQIPHYLYIPAEDRSGFDLSKYFLESINFIKDSLEKTNILVHCLAGVSRSVSLVIAYLIKQKGKSFQSAFHMLRLRRKIINPNNGFISQLKRFQTECSRNPMIEDSRKYSNSPTKQYQVDYSKFYEKDYRRSRVMANGSPQRYQQYASPIKYESPSKNRFNVENYYSPYESASRVRKPYPYYENNTSRQRQNPQNRERSQIYSFRTNNDQSLYDFKQSRIDFATINQELDDKIARIRQKYATYTQKNITKPRQVKINNYFNENDLNRSLSITKNPNYDTLRRNTRWPRGMQTRRFNSIQKY